MTDQPSLSQPMQLAVIVTEFGAAANVGGSPETKVRLFDLPSEIAEYIKASRGQWATISLGFGDAK